MTRPLTSRRARLHCACSFIIASARVVAQQAAVADAQAHIRSAAAAAASQPDAAAGIAAVQPAAAVSQSRQRRAAHVAARARRVPRACRRVSTDPASWKVATTTTRSAASGSTRPSPLEIALVPGPSPGRARRRQDIGPTTAPFRGPSICAWPSPTSATRKAPSRARLGPAGAGLRRTASARPPRVGQHRAHLGRGPRHPAPKALQADVFGASLVRSLPDEFDKSGNGNRLAGVYGSTADADPARRRSSRTSSGGAT